MLRLLAAEGLVSLGTISLDGTKLAGSAAQKANRTLPAIEKLLAEAAAADAAEDARLGGQLDEPTRGRWRGGLSGAAGWPPPGTGWRPRIRPAATRSAPGRKLGTHPRRPESGAAGGAPATSRASTATTPSRGPTSPTRTCG